MTHNSAPILSIITIVYQDPDALRKTLGSLTSLSAAFPFPWQHIVVDSSPEIHHSTIAALPATWPLKHIAQAPNGIYAAMNEGVLSCSGSYLWFLNAGDTLESAETLKSCIASLEANRNAPLAIAGANLYRNESFLYHHRTRNFPLALLGINRVCHQAVVYRRSLFTQGVGLFNTNRRLAADYEHHLEILLGGGIPEIIPGTLSGYDMGGQSSNQNKVMNEFFAVHRSLRARMSTFTFLSHRCVWVIETLRLKGFSILKASFLGSTLQKLRLQWKRTR